MPSEFDMHLIKLAHMRKCTHEPRDHLYIDMGIGLTVSIQISYLVWLERGTSSMVCEG